MDTRRMLACGVVTGVVASLVASAAKQLSEPPLQRAAERLWPPGSDQKRLVGADPTGRPAAMPPAVLADRLTRAAGGAPLSPRARVLSLHVIHYGFGAVLGAGYGALAVAAPRVTRWSGAPAGLAVYLLSHGSALPVLRVQEPAWRLPPAAVGWEAASHVVFGVALEASRRALTTLLSRASPSTHTAGGGVTPRRRGRPDPGTRRCSG